MQKMLRRMNAMRGPDWRMQVAYKLAAKEPLTDDLEAMTAKKSKPSSLLRTVVAYLRDCAGGHSYATLVTRYPRVVAAMELNASRSANESVKLYVLAGASRARIAKRCGLSSDVVRAWELLFFDVRLLRSSPAGLAAVTVTREIEAGNPEFASKMKLAYGGGLLAVEAMMRNAAGAYLSAADAVYQRELALELRVSQSLCIPLDSESGRLQFQTVYLKYLNDKSKIDLARERLRARIHIAEARLEIARQRVEKERAEPKKIEPEIKPEIKVMGDPMAPASRDDVPTTPHQQSDAA